MLCNSSCAVYGGVTPSTSVSVQVTAGGEVSKTTGWYVAWHVCSFSKPASLLPQQFFWCLLFSRGCIVGSWTHSCMRADLFSTCRNHVDLCGGRDELDLESVTEASSVCWWRHHHHCSVQELPEHIQCHNLPCDLWGCLVLFWTIKHGIAHATCTHT